MNVLTYYTLYIKKKFMKYFKTCFDKKDKIIKLKNSNCFKIYLYPENESKTKTKIDELPKEFQNYEVVGSESNEPTEFLIRFENGIVTYRFEQSFLPFEEIGEFKEIQKRIANIHSKSWNKKNNPSCCNVCGTTLKVVNEYQNNTDMKHGLVKDVITFCEKCD